MNIEKASDQDEFSHRIGDCFCVYMQCRIVNIEKVLGQDEFSYGTGDGLSARKKKGTVDI